jgi:hypothetical protein
MQVNAIIIIIIIIIIIGSAARLLGLTAFSVYFLYTVGRNAWTGDQLIARLTNRINEHTDIHTSSGIRSHCDAQINAL